MPTMKRPLALTDDVYIMRLPCVRVSERFDLENRRLPNLNRHPPAVRKLSPEQEELIEIRKRCGMSQAEFAEAVGIGMPRLSSYEHGRTGGIPEWIMQAARALGETHESDQAARFTDLDMPTLLAQWAKRLDVPYEDNRRLAALLGTTVPSLTRWKNGLTRPRLQSLLFHEQMVEQACAKLSKQAERIETPAQDRRGKPAKARSK